jgi:hypothetical protein
MEKTSFASLLADAITFHEGWAVGSASYNNLNPGNLVFDHQAGAIDSGDEHHFAKFETFYAGQTALVNDIAAKIDAGLTSVQAIIDRYAPPEENDTSSYVDVVLDFLLWRCSDVSAVQPYSEIPPKAEILVVINQIFEPADWHAIQQAISRCAGYMPEYSFIVAYSNADLSNDIIQVNSPLISAQTSVVSLPGTQGVVTRLAQGQTLSVLVYDGTIMQGHPTPAGGCEYQQFFSEPTITFSSVMYEGAQFIDPTARILFHELIHELFSLTKQTDILHAYLIDHGGYDADLAEDLTAVFTGNQLNTPQAISALETQEKVEEQ